MVVTYGKKTFTKLLGYFGEKVECPKCGRSYCRSLVKYKTWGHIYEIPIIPLKTQYVVMCPICAGGYVLDKKEGKAIAQGKLHMNEDLTVYGKDILAKHQKGVFKADVSKELWVRDNKTGEEILVAEGIAMLQIREQKKSRGLKKLSVTKV